ncbi:MAG: thioesterase II family protein [Rickettsiaceae bacterium]
MSSRQINKSVNVYSKNPDASYKYRLICFPHAGGSASFFRHWEQSFIEAEVCSVKYPGRAERISEPLPFDLVKMSEEIALDITNLTDLPIVFFGHSMGAVVALEVAKALENRNIYVEYLFVSGSKKGNIPKYSDYTEESDEKISNDLIEMGGTNIEMINDPLFQDLVMPAIKADGKMFHSYRMDNTKLNCSIVSICGTEDIHSDIRPWNQLTTNTHTEYFVPGGHFYLIDSPPLQEIKSICKKIK